MSNNLKAAVLIGLSIAMSGVCDANAATISETDPLSNPTQIPIETPIALLFIGAALLFLPSISQSAVQATEANAGTLNFAFSFTGSPGTVTGEIDGLSNNSTSAASAVFLNSFPAAFLGPVCSTPCNMTASPPWSVVANKFTVSNGQLTAEDFLSRGPSPSGLFLFDGSGLLVGPTGADVKGTTTFSRVEFLSSLGSTPPSTPLPAALPLFATGLGALGLLGWRRKRKARVSLLGAA